MRNELLLPEIQHTLRLLQENRSTALRFEEIYHHLVQKLVITPVAENAKISSIISLKNNKMAVASGSTIQIWNLTENYLERTLHGHTTGVTSLFELPNKQLASSGYDSTLCLWDVNDGKCIKNINLLAACYSLSALTGSSEKLLAGTLTGTKLWNITSGQLEKNFTGHSNVRSVIPLPNTQQFASASEDHTVCIWDMATGSCIQTLQGHTDYVTSLVVMDGKLVSGSWDGTVRIWNLTTFACEGTSSASFSMIRNLSALSADQLMVGSYNNNSVSIYNIKTNAIEKNISTNFSKTDGFALLPNQQVAVGAPDGRLNIMPLKMSAGLYSEFQKAMLLNTSVSIVSGHTFMSDVETAFFTAIRDRNKALIKCRTTNALFTLLHYAAEQGLLDVVKARCAQPGIDVEGVCSLGKTALDYAVAAKKTDVVAFLNAHPAIIKTQKMAALEETMRDQQKTIDMMLTQMPWLTRAPGIPVVITPTIDSLIAVARKHYHSDFPEVGPVFPARAMAHEVAVVHECPILGLTMCNPVITAAGNTYEREAIEKWLKDHDSDPATNAVLPHKNLVPNIAIRRLILEFFKANPDYQHSNKSFLPKAHILALRKAICDGNLTDIKKYVQQHKHILAYYLADDRTVLHAALEAGNLEIFRYLLSELLPSEAAALHALAKPNNFYPAVLNDLLFESVRAGDIVNIEFALHWGVDVDVRNDSHQTPLCVASALGNLPVVNLLLERGANISARDAKDLCPLDHALLHNQDQVANTLLDKGLPDYMPLSETDAKHFSYMALRFAHRQKPSQAIQVPSATQDVSVVSSTAVLPISPRSPRLFSVASAANGAEEAVPAIESPVKKNTN